MGRGVDTSALGKGSWFFDVVPLNYLCNSSPDSQTYVHSSREATNLEVPLGGKKD